MFDSGSQVAERFRDAILRPLVRLGALRVGLRGARKAAPISSCFSADSGGVGAWWRASRGRSRRTPSPARRSPATRCSTMTSGDRVVSAPTNQLAGPPQSDSIPSWPVE